MLSENCFTITNLASLRVEVDGVDKGTRVIKLESPLSELDQLLKAVLDPMDFMCQTLGISSKSHLDKILTKTLVEKIPKNGFSCLKLVKEQVQNLILERGEKEKCFKREFVQFNLKPKSFRSFSVSDFAAFCSIPRPQEFVFCSFGMSWSQGCHRCEKCKRFDPA